MLNLLQTTTKSRVEYIIANPGMTLQEYGQHFAVADDHSDELNIPLDVRKGSVGVFVEWLLTGVRGDNKCAADDGLVDIKTLSVTRKSRKNRLFNDLSPKENLRLTTVNFNGIQTVSFDNSGLMKKSIMLVVLVSSDEKELKDRKIEGIGFININDHIEQVKRDYEYVATTCREGNAHKLTSSTNQPCQVVKVYSHSSGKGPSAYVDSRGRQCEAKGKSFYLFKEQICSMLQMAL